jgi:hypothetical protein
MKNIANRFASLLLLLALGLSGCVNLAPIREFTSRAPDSAVYQDLTAHYLGHHDYLKRFRAPAQWPDLDQRAIARQKQEEALLGLHRGLVEYLNALGTLASDELVSYDTALDDLADEIKAQNLVFAAQADAFVALSGFIAKAATDGYRRRKLKAFISAGNEPFQNVVAALTNIVGRDFVRELDSERGEADGYYQEIIADAEESGTQHAALALLKERQFAQARELGRRQEACRAYVAALRAMARAHQTLYDRRDQLPTRETLAMIYSYSQEIKALRAKLKTLNQEGVMP